jgi:uncharacterized damage-inducible protein DinB
MKRRGVQLSLLLILLLGAGVRSAAAAEWAYASDFKAHWNRLRDMMTAIVAAMPEDKYDYRPVKEVRSFREMAVHLIQDGITHTAWIAGMPKEESDKLGKKYENYKTRAEILSGMQEMFDQGEKNIASITNENAHDMVVGMRSEQMTRVQAALVAFEDQMDHYGNFVVYLRINGVVPPSTANSAKEREENMKKMKQSGKEMPMPADEMHMH